SAVAARAGWQPETDGWAIVDLLSRLTGGLRDFARNPSPPVGGILLDLNHESPRDRTGRTCALLPRADCIWVNTEELCKNDLAHPQDDAYSANILGAIRGAHEAIMVTAGSKPASQRRAGAHHLDGLLKGRDDFRACGRELPRSRAASARPRPVWPILDALPS